MTVDEILASGRYTDRRGRRFGKILPPSADRGKWLQWWPEIHPWPEELLSITQMRLLILRDKHRDVCEGLRNCRTHPVPHVIAYEDDLDDLRRWGWGFAVYGVGSGFPFDYDTLPAAMDAASTLAVSE